MKSEFIQSRFHRIGLRDVIAQQELRGGFWARLPILFYRPRCVIWASAALMLMVLCNQRGFAQATTARLSGTVADTSGASVPGANVTVLNTGTGVKMSTQTGNDGMFSFPALPVGSYDLTAEKSGFEPYLQNGILLTVGQAATLSVELKVGTTTQQVVVTADTGMLTTSTGTVSQLVDQKRIVDLPLNGRDANTLVFLGAGTANTTEHYCLYACQGGVDPSAQEASVSGGETANVDYELDGTDHNDSYVNSNLPFPNPDAIQEFTLQSSNMTAEYGNSANVVDIITKSGTNQFHGDVFEFIRNGQWNARDYFAPVQDTLRRNQYGGTVGGPIKKDHLFFFGTYQGTKITQAPAGEVEFVPTAAERQGNFGALCSAYNAIGLCMNGDGTQLNDPVTGIPFANNLIPQARLSPPALNMLPQIPLSTGSNGEVTFPGPTTNQKYDQYMPKIDWYGGRNHLSGRYFYSNSAEPPNLAAAQTNLLEMDPNGNAVKVQTVSVIDNYAMSRTLLFTTAFGWDSQVGGSVTGATKSLADYGVEIAKPTIPQWLNMNVKGYFNVYGNETGYFNRGDKVVREVVTWQKGRHELIFGGQLTRINQNLINPFLQGGQMLFKGKLSGNNLADFMLGQASTFNVGAGQYTSFIGGPYNLFAQDNWQVNKKLALNLGLRWDPFLPYSEAQNAVSCYVPGQLSQRFPNAPTGLIYGGEPNCPAGTAMFKSMDKFSPRVGFAYSLDEKTVLRGGAGIYYTYPQSSYANSITSNPPFAPSFSFTDVSFQNPWASVGVADPFPAEFGLVSPGPTATFTLPVSPDVFQTSFQPSTLVTWNLTVERQFLNDWLLGFSYVGNKGYDLSSNQEGGPNLNPAVYIPGQSTEANTQQRLINPNFGPIYVASSINHSDYNALQVNLQRRFSRGLSLEANYTRSHQLDDFPANPNDFQTDPSDLHFDWGNSDDNVPNIFHLSSVWQIPHPNSEGFAGRFVNGWELTSIVTWQNGFPFNLYSGVDNSFTDEGADRPDFIGAFLSQAVLHNQPRKQMIAKYFNTSLFVPNAIGTFGNIGKNVFTGPRYFDTDLGLIKDTKLTEKTTLQLRWEVFNAFNTVNFATPGNTLGSATFGVITSTSGAGASPGTFRVLQFAGKISF